MGFIETTDILDDDLSPLVKDADITNVTDWFTMFAREQNVPASKIKKDPLVFECKRVCVLWVCCEVARRNVGRNITVSANGTNTDWYQKKLDAYKPELMDALRACTPNAIMGISTEADDNSESLTTYERA